MKFYKYGITLERLKEEDIELVRQWRNSDAVRLNMNFREIISPEQQMKWFESINTVSYHYVLIHYQGEKIGLLNDKNIDWEARTSETGIFIGRPEFFHTYVPYLVSVAGIETLFYFFNWKKQFAHVMRSNANAVRYNLELGYRLCEGQEETEYQLYELTKESFERTAGKIRKMVRLVAGNDIRPRLLIEPADYKSGIAQKFEEILNSSPIPNRRLETQEGTWYLEQEDNEIPKTH